MKVVLKFWENELEFARWCQVSELPGWLGGTLGKWIRQTTRSKKFICQILFDYYDTLMQADGGVTVDQIVLAVAKDYGSKPGARALSRTGFSSLVGKFRKAVMTSGLNRDVDEDKVKKLTEFEMKTAYLFRT